MRPRTGTRATSVHLLGMERHANLIRAIIGEFYYVYNRLEFGFVETIYAAALERRLRRAGLGVVREYDVQVYFDGEPVGFQRLDMVVQAAVVVELKASATLAPYAKRQLFNYLRATNLEAGLLLHFGPQPVFQKLFSRKRALNPGLGAPDAP